MNHDLSLWDGAHLLPGSFEQACQALEKLEAQRPGLNTKFMALAQAMQSAPGVDASWSASLGKWAKQVPEAVWHLSLPADDLILALRAVVEQARAFGLVVFSEPLGMAFLPNGGILPPEMQAQWAQLLVQSQASPPLNKAEVVQLTATLLRQRLAPHGFVPRMMGSGWDAVFVRPTPDGYQCVQMRVVGSGPDYKCMLRCGHRSDEVEALFEQIFGTEIRIPETFWFHPTAFAGARSGSLPIENSGEIRALLDLFARHALPVLELARLPGGLDRVMNEPQRFPFDYPGLHPQAPQNLANEYISYGRNLCLKPLILAWLARSPAFEARVADLRRFVQGRADVSESDIARVVDHLRALPALGR
jgi:hypothetical protein